MKRAIPVIIFIMAALVPVKGQKTRDVLYLKNGSLIYGKLMEVSQSEFRIKTFDGSLFIFPANEVDKFQNEAIGFDGRRNRGAGVALEGGFMVGSQESQFDAPFSFNYIAGYTVNKKNIFGAGSGVEFIGQSFIPVFAEYKRLLNDKKTAPFLFIRSGQLFHVAGDDNSEAPYSQYDYTKHYKGGFTFTLGTGISWFKNDYETYLSFAYRNAHTSYRQQDYNYHYSTYRNTLNRLEIKFGFRF